MLRVWNLNTPTWKKGLLGALRTVHNVEGDYGSASYSPDGSLLMAATGHNIYGWSTSDWSQVFHVRDGSERPVRFTDVSNSSIITWGVNSVTIRDIHTSQTVGRLVFADERKWIYTLALAPDRSAFALGCGDGRIELWNLKSLHQSQPADSGEDDVRHRGARSQAGRAIAFSPNGHHLAFCRNNYMFSILDAQNGSTVISRSMIDDKSHQEDVTDRCYFTGDGRSLIVSSLSSRPGLVFGSHCSDYTSFGSLRRLSVLDLRSQAVYRMQGPRLLGGPWLVSGWSARFCPKQ